MSRKPFRNMENSDRNLEKNLKIIQHMDHSSLLMMLSMMVNGNMEKDGVLENNITRMDHFTLAIGLITKPMVRED